MGLVKIISRPSADFRESHWCVMKGNLAFPLLKIVRKFSNVYCLWLATLKSWYFGNFENVPGTLSRNFKVYNHCFHTIVPHAYNSWKETTLTKLFIGQKRAQFLKEGIVVCLTNRHSDNDQGKHSQKARHSFFFFPAQNKLIAHNI